MAHPTTPHSSAALGSGDDRHATARASLRPASASDGRTRRATPSALLRLALRLDTLATGATALAMLLLSERLAVLLGLPAALLLGAGAVLLPFALAVGWMSTRTSLRRGAVVAVVGMNALWVIDSVALLLGGWVQPTTLGTAYVVAQALAVGVMAEMQAIGLRRSA